MDGGVDNGELEQIKDNVHQKVSDVYIPCITVFSSFLGEKNEFSDSSEVFFEFASIHKSKGLELKQRKDPIRVFRTSPIQDLLQKIANENYEKNKNLNISKAVHLTFSSTEPPLFESVMLPELSIFEKASILKEECGEFANIIIISNHKKINDVKTQAEKESGRTFSQDEFSIINTNDWFEEMMNVKENSDVSKIFFNLLKKRKKIQIGQFKGDSVS